jgi:hypothetical protein
MLAWMVSLNSTTSLADQCDVAAQASSVRPDVVPVEQDYATAAGRVEARHQVG